MTPYFNVSLEGHLRQIWLNTNNHNTVELVQSDTWVFRHPVTLNKNLWVVYGDGQSSICGGGARWCYRKWSWSEVTRTDTDRKWRQSRDRKRSWPEVTSQEVTSFFPRATGSWGFPRFSPPFFPGFPYFFRKYVLRKPGFSPVLFFSALFSRTFFPILFFRSFFPVLFFPYFFFPYFFPVFFFSVSRDFLLI